MKPFTGLAIALPACDVRRSQCLDLDRLSQRIEAAVVRVPVALLALRLPQFERTAWREGKRAAQRLERRVEQVFADAAGRLLRRGDSIAHDRGSDTFVAALLERSRDERDVAAPAVRSVLERMALAISECSRQRVESGWISLRARADVAPLRDAIAAALERGSRERERYEFFAAIGHELRTPLTSIRGYIETLLDGDLEPESRQRFLQVAQREALRMGRMLEGMFEFSLLDLSADRLLAGCCDLARQMALACEVVQPAARARSMTVTRNPCDAPSVAVDPDACLQLLVNLLDNAIKYGKEGGTVVLGARLFGGRVTIAVDDDGPGVGALESEAIFQARVRGSGSGNRPGSGIGLSIVKMIAERAGGEIVVSRSALGGARFEVSLPAPSPQREMTAGAS